MKIEMPKLTPADFRCSCPITVRFRDLDAMGHVNNAVYSTFFEIARTAYMRALDLPIRDGASLQERFPFVVIDLYCRFLSAVMPDEDLKAYVRISRLGNSSFVFEYLLASSADGRHVALGRTTQASFDYARNRSVRMPENFRRAVMVFEGMNYDGRGSKDGM